MNLNVFALRIHRPRAKPISVRLALFEQALPFRVMGPFYYLGSLSPENFHFSVCVLAGGKNPESWGLAFFPGTQPWGARRMGSGCWMGGAP